LNEISCSKFSTLNQMVRFETDSLNCALEQNFAHSQFFERKSSIMFKKGQICAGK